MIFSQKQEDLIFASISRLRRPILYTDVKIKGLEFTSEAIKITDLLFNACIQCNNSARKSIAVLHTQIQTGQRKRKD